MYCIVVIAVLYNIVLICVNYVFFFLILCLHVLVLFNLPFFCELFFFSLFSARIYLYYCFGEQNNYGFEWTAAGFSIDTDTRLKYTDECVKKY